eukprot:CAMPEP_0202442392 /NCGR_PEP_ID=MMETSP1360-20130828/1840_1 /ASSEMBLY_ACC=CAM_ASM_000848 /TAXON_ID=515479 /ORGANISM="Licmophora paradoxa, Strain CCMP2313" /LENGTH=788 /DNA_ID=CAMNT_0049057745 /DNA_START=274 /DNA_END=2640 /DNA_ORIENTATION=-
MAFLLTFGIMKTQRMLNYTKFGLRIKLLALAGIFFVVWDFNAGLFDLLFTVFFPQGPPSIGLANGPLYEWYYHTHLHHWAVFVGIVYAINYPITSLLMDKTELLADTQATLAKGTVCISLIVALSLWLSGPFTTPKFAFDSTHPYFAFLPILSYVYFRNVTQWMRQHHLGIFKSLGSFSLEIYLFHKHIFMANDGTQMLVLVPGYPKCNVVATGILLLVVARTVHKMTVIVGGMILPSDNEGKCIRAFITIGVCGTAFYCLALLLEYMEMKSATVILITIMIIGFIVYQTILDLTWNEYRNVDRQGINDEEETPVAKASPPIIGAMVIFVLGISWHIIAMAGAAGGQGALPVLCESFVNEGIWAPVSSCSEYQRGLDTREYHVAGYYRACDSSETMHWGWRKTRPNTRCRFRSRTVSDLQKKLAYRRIVFVGDLTVRNIFHAFCRSLGDPEAGRYDATIADHADISKQIGIVKLEYKWAPLAFDQVNKLKNLRSKGQKGGADLLIVGGGTLDRLHVWATDEDQESHKAAVQKLVKELDYATAPTVWCTPTTVNTPALLNDEKRNQMNEMAISEVRKMYQDLDVETTANFVLEGPAYSRGRVSESYDGMMYPHSVYDAGVQIIANALDWLIVPSADGEEDDEEPFHPPPVGQLSNPFLGLMMTCFSLIGLFFFDGYFGFSYLSSLFVRGDGLKSTKRRQMQNFMPNDLYDDAFVPFHQRLKLPLSKSDASSYRAKQQLTQSGRGRVQDIHLPQLAHDSDVLSLLDNDSLLGGGDRGSSRRGLGMMTRRK